MKRNSRFRHSRSTGAHEHRHFLGECVSNNGIVNLNRQFMLAITDAEKSGVLTGFTVRERPPALSLVEKPAGYSHFYARL